MRFELFKILDKKYVEDFVSGNLYMNTLNYFRNIEGNAAQGDPLEGVCGAIPKDQLKQYGIHFSKELVNVIRGNVFLVSEYYGLNNVFCLYKLLMDENRKVIELPSNELCKFNDTEAESKVVIRIKDTERFLQLVADALEREISLYKVEYGVYGSVTYTDSWANADGPGTRSIYYKESKFGYQNEWRISVLRKGLPDQAYSFSIGDISDITEMISLEQFLEHPEELYPGYKTTTERLTRIEETYSILGSMDAVNHLMFAYMNPQKQEVIRSDEAQADWHYTQFLELTGKGSEVDAYLEKRMKEMRNFDYLEMLVQYRLSIGAWVKATDAFYFFIKEAPEVIEENPERFFFPLHTILMQNQQAVDAGKLYKIATERYQLSESLKQTMLGDVWVALGFYDKVIPHFLEMKKTSEDPVLDYYLAVSYLHMLDFESAHQHLSVYEQYFAHSPEWAKKSLQLRGLVNCFRNKEKREPKEECRLSEIGWRTEVEEMLKNASQRGVFLGIDTLYQLEKEQKWMLIEKFEEISIVPLTIAEIMRVYMETGDETLYNVIQYLAKNTHVKIESPDLLYYLAIDIRQEDLPAFMKMERALFLQEEHKKQI